MYAKLCRESSRVSGVTYGIASARDAWPTRAMGFVHEPPMPIQPLKTAARQQRAWSHTAAAVPFFGRRILCCLCRGPTLHSFANREAAAALVMAGAPTHRVFYGGFYRYDWTLR